MTVLLNSHRFGAPAAFTPADLGSLVLWGRNPGAGSPASWTDDSGAGHPLVQGTGGSQPTYDAGNGELDFDGVDDWMQAAFTLPEPCTLVVVGRFNSTGVAKYMTDGAGWVNSMCVYTNGSNFCAVTSGTTVWDSGVPQDTSYHIFVLTLFLGLSRFRIDGGAGLSINATGISPGGLTLGTNKDGGPTYGDVSIREVVLCNADLSLGDLNNLGTYLDALHPPTWVTAT